MHRDLKIDNILVNVDDKGNVKGLRICDFEYACAIDDLESSEN